MLSYIPDHYLRLESRSHDRDLENGFAARIYDPLWFLARQWMMGEHQAENASTPVQVTYQAGLVRLDTPPVDGRDPTVTPAEAIIESEADDWWTIGRRIRFGAMFAARLAQAGRDVPESARLRHLSPPYEAFEGGPDGLALWKTAPEVGLNPTDFPQIPAEPPKNTWKPAELAYSAGFPSAQRDLTAPHHAGGDVDWYTVDAAPQAQPFDPGPLEDSVAHPSQLQYPGAPHDRWWEIESAAVDIGGFPPDRAQFATLLLTDLVLSHSVDWFTFPVPARGGHILTVYKAIVKDGFGEEYALEFVDPAEWSLFRTAGLEQNTLVSWLTAPVPLQGRPLETVQFGLDEYSNLLWAVERRIDGRSIEFVKKDAAVPPGAQQSADLTAERKYVYRTGDDVAPFWHPYQIDEDGERVYRQARLDAALFPNLPEAYVEEEGGLRLLPAARAKVITLDAGIHTLNPAAVPINGLEVERTWRLARDTYGRPVLWVQRQRKPLLAPPGRRFRYDVMKEQTV